VSDWTWEYVPDAASVVGGLTSEQIAEIEALAARLPTLLAFAGSVSSSIFKRPSPA
jgi:hypothetical protein